MILKINGRVFSMLMGLLAINISNAQHKDDSQMQFEKGSFGADFEFLKSHAEIIRLEKGSSHILIAPKLQGRVLTSTLDGPDGLSQGFINHDRIKSDKIEKHIQAYGGEDRFWLGPQGGQYTIYFHPGDEFTFDNWFTPDPIDKEAFEVVKRNKSSVTLKKSMDIANYQKTTFQLELIRKISLLDRKTTQKLLNTEPLENVKFVGFESRNEVKNTGEEEWTNEKGLISIWILGMFPGGAEVVIPLKASADTKGKIVNEYFTSLVGEVGQKSLRIDEGTIFYEGDGDYIGKIGIEPKNATNYFGSYDPNTEVLTIIHYSPLQDEADYVNSQWEIQENPYKGDVINSYNDGNLERTAREKKTFYELETSSPALKLKPNQKYVHYHRTFHFMGNRQALNKISKTTLGVSIDQILEQINRP
ncbi:DUF6786 family protein [Marinoscillum sp.]|uniref:DUF6786 family protein n=1 Tax=Marinoscillum sp. TaxID=2024838 RepID=UPI003BAC95A0